MVDTIMLLRLLPYRYYVDKFIEETCLIFWNIPCEWLTICSECVIDWCALNYSSCIYMYFQRNKILQKYEKKPIYVGCPESS